MSINVEDFVYTTVVTSLEHLSLYLMVSQPPPKEVWTVQERVMNNLMRAHDRHEVDIKALEDWKNECRDKAARILDAEDEEIELSTASEEFKACFNYYLAHIVLQLHHAMLKKDTADEALTHLTSVNLLLRTIHGFAEPALKQLVMGGYLRASEKG